MHTPRRPPSRPPLFQIALLRFRHRTHATATTNANDPKKPIPPSRGEWFCQEMGEIQRKGSGPVRSRSSGSQTQGLGEPDSNATERDFVKARSL